MDTKCVTNELSVDGRKLLLNDKHFYLQGLSFFNAIYNPNFNSSDNSRKQWMQKFKDNGINMLRIWCQWDFGQDKTIMVDVADYNTMYTEDGEINEHHFETLVKIILLADSLDMVIEVVLFSNEKQPNLPIKVQEKVAGLMTQKLMPYRNIILQIWNEKDTEVARYYKKIKSVDSERLVSNSAGWGEKHLGSEEDSILLEILTPHTERTHIGKFWELAAKQIEVALNKYNKVVIDDEPARCGTMNFGGIKGGTLPEQHIEQIKLVRALGAYHIYHHDMFQCGYGDPTIPPNGIPDPDFSLFHRKVFDYLRDNKVW